MADLLAGLLRLRRDGVATLAAQLTMQLRALVASGRLRAGQRLPSSREMAGALRVSRNTVTAALEQLAAEGYLESSPGKRAIVKAGLHLAGDAMPGAASKPHKTARDISAWAEGLPGGRWPPVYPGRPRPFQPGLADDREFPHDVWGRCLRHAAAAARRRGQGAHNQSPNRAALQKALLRHLAEHRGVRAVSRQVIIVPAAQSGIALIARVMVAAGDVAWIESPGYGGAKAALETAGAVVAGVPLDAAGLAIRRRGPPPRLIFTTPSHQYPTGLLMPVGRRLELLAFASSLGAGIIEDDYDGEFHYDGRPVAALQGLAGETRVFYVGTFAKAMVTDMRLGYVVVPEDLIETFELAQRHLGMLASVTLQDALAEFIDMGAYRAHLRRMLRIYRRRRDVAVEAIAAAAGARLLIEAPAGGMQLAALCADGLDDVQLAADLLEAGVIAVPLSGLYFHEPAARGLFLGFAAWNEAEIGRAAEVLGRLVRTL